MPCGCVAAGSPNVIHKTYKSDPNSVSVNVTLSAHSLEAKDVSLLQ